MTEYISAYNTRISRWNLQDFEWYRIVTSGELPAYCPFTEHRLVDQSKVETRKLTEEEIRAYADLLPTEGKSSDQIASHMHNICKPIPILPPNTEIFYFDPYHVKNWLYSIGFKMDDVLAFEAHRGIIPTEPVEKVVSKEGVPIQTALPDSTPVKATINFFTRGEDKHWRVGFNGKECIIDPLDGIYYIAILLQKPGTSISSRELIQSLLGKMPDKVMAEDVLIAGGMSIGHKMHYKNDTRSRKEYQNAYDFMQEKLNNSNDIEEREELEAKMKKLQLLLKEKLFVNPEDGKAQDNVKKRLETAYKAIDEAGMTELANHLREKIEPNEAYGRIYTGTLNWEITIK